MFRRLFIKNPSIRRCFSTTPPIDVLPLSNKSTVVRIKEFVSKNSQKLINIVHNLKVQKAWEAKEKEVVLIEEELTLLKDSLLDIKWIEEVEKKVKASKNNSILHTEIVNRIKTVDAKIEEREIDIEKIAEIGELAALVESGEKKSVGVPVVKVTGRVI